MTPLYHGDNDDYEFWEDAYYHVFIFRGHGNEPL
jgi:hypothetical protein